MCSPPFYPYATDGSAKEYYFVRTLCSELVAFLGVEWVLHRRDKGLNCNRNAKRFYYRDNMALSDKECDKLHTSDPYIYIFK